MKIIQISIFWTALYPFAAPALAKGKSHKAHHHGMASLSIAAEGRSLHLALEAPGDVIFGFEHAPRDEGQRQIVRDALKSLREKAAELFALDTEAGCKVVTVRLEAAQEDQAAAPTTKPATKAHDEHADVEASYELACAKPLAGQTLKLGLFKEFPRLTKLKVQVLGDQGQKGLVATAQADVVKL